MCKILVLKGLPASGKSTFAKELIRKDSSFIRINKDDLRAMFHNSKHSNSKEGFILKVRDFLIRESISEGKSVIVDDTNLNPIHLSRFVQLGIELNAEVEISDEFLKVPLDECIRRDLQRDKPVGEKVILEMYYRYVHRENFYPDCDINLPNCIIVDIDGTVANMNGKRNPFEWDKVDLDAPKFEILHIVESVVLNIPGTNLIFLSGRDEICREKTEQWLRTFLTERVKEFQLYMRPQGNSEDDRIIKRKLFDDNIRGKYNVKFVLDDRRRVVNMWREMGLTCLEVADHRF